MENKTIKMTKKLALTTTIENWKEIPADVKEVFEKEIARLEKKAATPKKPTKHQLANEAHKETVMEMFTANPNTIFGLPELVKKCTFVEEGVAVEMTVNRLAAILKPLKEAGKVTRIEEKGKVYYQLAKEIVA